MVATHERRSGSAGGGPLLAGLVISCLMVGTAWSSTQPAPDEPDYPHAYPREGVTRRFENERVIIWEGIGQPERHSVMVDMKDHTPPRREPRTDVPPAFHRAGATQKLDADRVTVQSVLCGGWNTAEFFRTASLETVTVCLGRGADPDASAMWGETPLHMAVSAVHESVAAVGVLLAGGADPEALTEDGRTPLHTAALSSADPSTIRVLVASGANPQARMQAGWTPLHLAARFNKSPEVVRALLDGGADPMVRDDHGRLPADLAEQNAALSGTDVLGRLDSGNDGR